MASPPVSELRLKQIATDACDSALANAETYVHSQTPTWNNAIINSILKSLISETTPSSSSEKSTTSSTGQAPFKFAVNSTIIQHPSHTSSATSTNGESGSGAAGSAGRRGMHSAAGAYWNNERDGMWSYKYEQGERKGMDVVLSVMWIAI